MLSRPPVGTVKQPIETHQVTCTLCRKRDILACAACSTALSPRLCLARDQGYRLCYWNSSTLLLACFVSISISISSYLFPTHLFTYTYRPDSPVCSETEDKTSPPQLSQAAWSQYAPNHAIGWTRANRGSHNATHWPSSDLLHLYSGQLSTISPCTP